MDKIILGLLMIRPLTIYELRQSIETNFAQMCSSSMGSIQAAVKKLVKNNLAAYEELVEHGVSKKRYALTPAGGACFSMWVQTAMLAGKTKETELSKLFFMGFVPAEKRLPLIEAYLTGLKKEREALEKLRLQDSEAAAEAFAVCLEENPETRNRFLQAAGTSCLRNGIREVVCFQLLTLQLGIDRIDFETAWFEGLRAELIRGLHGSDAAAEKEETA